MAEATAYYEQARESLLANAPAYINPDAQKYKESWQDARLYMERRLAALRDWRLSWWVHWADLATNILPRRYHWLITPNTMIRGKEINANIVDTTVVKAFRICAAGLMSGLTSPSRPWFKLKPSLPGLKDVPQDWQLWFDQVENRIYQIMAGSNFYDGLTQLFQDLVCFGTAPMIIYEDFKDIIRCYNPCAGEYYLANGGDFRVNTFYRTFTMTVAQMVEFFDPKKLPAQVLSEWNNKGGSLEKEYVVAHCLEPNFPASSSDFEKKNLAVIPGGFIYREYYWLWGQDSAVPMSQRGFMEQPYICPRWETTSNDAYGRSVGMDVLPDIKQLYLMQKRLAEAIEKQIRPPMQADVALKNQPASILPGAVTYVADVAKGGMRPIYEVTPEIQGMLSQIEALQVRVQEGFYNDLFMIISQMEGVQPRNEMEIAERKNEKMQELGPVIEKFQTEGASQAIKRIYSIATRRGLIPPKPQSMRGTPIEIEYISMLTLSQRAAKTAGMDRLLNVVGGFLKAGKPEAMDKINVDAYIDEYADDMTVPSKVMNSDQAIKAIRDGRAQQQQAMAKAQGVAAAAPAAKDASIAAANFADVAQGGGLDALQQMLGPSGVPNAGLQ